MRSLVFKRWVRSSHDNGMMTCLKNFWWYFEDSRHKNFPEKYAIILLVKLVKWGEFEDNLTSIYSSRVWVLYIIIIIPWHMNYNWTGPPLGYPIRKYGCCSQRLFIPPPIGLEVSAAIHIYIKSHIHVPSHTRAKQNIHIQPGHTTFRSTVLTIVTFIILRL